MLRKWKQQAESRSGLLDSRVSAVDVFPSHGRFTSQDEEICKLRREMELAKQE